MKMFIRQWWGQTILLSLAVTVGVTCFSGCLGENNPGNSGDGSSAGGSSTGGSGTTPIGNNNCGTDGTAASCKTVVIGNQTWMAENLNVPTSEGSWCYENSADSCAKYGRLYTWETAKMACPSGWHLPSREEWNALVSAVGSPAGTKLKSSSYWKYYSDSYTGTDNFGFSALPGGSRSLGGGFYGVGSLGNWWTATEDDGSGAYYRRMFFSGVGVNEYNDHKSYGFSVRCVAD